MVSAAQLFTSCLFRILDEISVHAIHEEIDLCNQFRYDTWSFDDTSAFVIYFIK